MIEMPKPKLLTPEDFPSICPVFTAASHASAVDKASDFFRLKSVQAAMWYRQPQKLNGNRISGDLRAFERAAKTCGVNLSYEERTSEKGSLRMHYDGAMSQAVWGEENEKKLFKGNRTRAIILRNNLDDLGTIIFDQGDRRYDDFDSCGHYTYESVFGTPWQAGCNSVLFLKGKEFGDDAVLHTEPSYDFTGMDISRSISVLGFKAK